MQLIKCKVKLKLIWTKHCVLSVAGTDNADGNNGVNNVCFTIKDTKLSIPVVTLSARDNEKLSKLFSKRFERSVYWNEYKTKSYYKNKTSKFSFFLESNFFGTDRLFFLVYTNQDTSSKIFKAKRYCLPKRIIDNYCNIINGKNFNDQANDSDIKRYEEYEQLTTGQGEDYTTRCLLDYY